MKSNKSMYKGGRLENQYYQTWADYYIKFIKEYEKRGINVWGLTVQNEPMATQSWESCIYSAEEEGDFLKNNLGPTLWKNGYKDKKVMIWDHNRDLSIREQPLHSAILKLQNMLRNRISLVRNMEQQNPAF
jgi:glucosylceramidase